MLGVGVGAWPEPTGGYDLWLPVLVALSFVLVRLVARLGVTWHTSIAAVVGGTLWSWSIDPAGVLAASAAALVVAFVGGRLVLRADARRRGHAA